MFLGLVQHNGQDFYDAPQMGVFSSSFTGTWALFVLGTNGKFARSRLQHFDYLGDRGTGSKPNSIHLTGKLIRVSLIS